MHFGGAARVGPEVHIVADAFRHAALSIQEGSGPLARRQFKTQSAAMLDRISFQLRAHRFLPNQSSDSMPVVRIDWVLWNSALYRGVECE
jgi:hypothetical protein